MPTDGTGAEAERDDELTGVLSRAAGMVQVQREIDRSQRSGVALVVTFLDVDGLKVINDGGGDGAGDEALRVVGEMLRKVKRSHDVIMRYGGDEFLCAHPGLPMATAAARMRRLRSDLANGPRPVAVTFGMAELQPEDRIDTLVARAEAALYAERDQR